MIKQSLLIILLFFTTYTVKAAEINFIKNNLEKVKSLAAVEGKPYFVKFTAAWCMPCRQMEQNTYTDPKLAYYVKQNYLAATVDVDDFDGYNYKEQYNIGTLPSILIFNSKGKLLARYQEVMTAQQMLGVLAKYNVPRNRTKLNVAPSQASFTSTPQPYSKLQNKISRPALKPNRTVATPNNSQGNKIKQQNYRPVPQGEGLYRLSISEQASKGYSVQVGLFEDYDNLLREAKRLDQLLKKPILVHVDKMNGKKVYKILVGEFKAKDAAILYRNRLEKQGIQGFIRDLRFLG